VLKKIPTVKFRKNIFCIKERLDGYIYIKVWVVWGSLGQAIGLSFDNFTSLSLFVVAVCILSDIKLGLDGQNRHIVDKLSTKPVVFTMQGELGVGKTQLVKGIARALGITNTVNSPSYQIMKEYDHNCGKLGGKLVHIDTWRLHEGNELLELGLKKIMQPGNVVAIEWLEKVYTIINNVAKNALIVWVTMESIDENKRTIRWKAGGGE